MPLHLDSFKNSLPVSCTNEVNLIGLESFKKDLEKYFFSDAVIRKSNSDPGRADLIIELECNFSLKDAVLNFREEIFNETRNDIADLCGTVGALQKKNVAPIDVEEFSLHLLDTTIIVQRIYKNSVLEQWNNVLRELIRHYDTLTHKLRETPFEIYVHVFEDQSLKDGSRSSYEEKGLHSNKDYFTYWGLYFDSEEDAVIYDVKTSSFIFEDLYMLNK